MLSSTAMDKLMQRTEAAIREWDAVGARPIISQPLADLTSEDTFQRSGEASVSRTNREAIAEPRQKQMIFHLHQGFNLIKKGKYMEAISHFQNEKALNQMGVTLKETPVWKNAIPGTVEDARQFRF